MTEFDQIIKQKVNEKQYAYTAKSWRSFAQKKGIHPGWSAWQVVAICVASAVVVSVGCILGFHYGSDSAGNSPVVNQNYPVKSIVVEEDTVGGAQVDTENVVDLVVEMPVEPPATATSNRARVQPQSESTQTAQSVDTMEHKPRVASVRPRTIRRVLVIDPDTIPNND